MTIHYQLRREKRQFDPRHVIVMTLAAAVVLVSSALTPTTHASTPVAACRAPMPATETRAEASMPMLSLSHLVFDASDNAMPATGDSSGGQ